MADTPYTQLRPKVWRGPTSSDDFNAQQEELYKDITVLYNRANFNKTLMDEGYREALKNIDSLQRALTDLETRIDLLENDQNTLSFYHVSQLDNTTFNGTPYEIPSVSRNTLDPRYGLMVLPRVETSSLSKLAFTVDNQSFVPPTLETKVVGIAGTADDTGTVIDTSEPEFAITRTAGRIWERNVIVNTPHVNGAQCHLYIKAPTDLFTTDKSNAILINPFPAQGTDILEISYTSDINFALDGNPIYRFFPAVHVSDPSAIGLVPPGSWSNGLDRDFYAPRRAYYFDPTIITGLRIRLGQRDYYTEGGQYIYSYGITDLDLRYDKFLSTGKALVRFDVPDGSTISSVSAVTPSIWNVAEASMSDVFSYRVVWETSFNSGVYTLTPVPLSTRVWVEVTLQATANGGTPALSGLTVQYS